MYTFAGRSWLVFMFCGMACGGSTETLKIKGSDTEVNLAARLAEEFYHQNKNYNLSVSGGGSGLGIASLLNGQADIANSSRPLKKEEIELFKKRNISFETFAFAEDAIAFVVSKDFPVDSLTVEQLANVLSGKTANWSSVTGKSLPVNIYGRQSNSGTHEFIKQKLHITYSPDAKEMNGNAQIIESIRSDPSGIGYVGAGYVMEENGSSGTGIKVLKIAAAKNAKAVSPLDERSIMRKQYYFQRPLYQFIRRESMTRAQAFIDFEKGKKGITIIKACGYYRVPK